MAQFHIATDKGPQPVEGVEYVATIGNREARLFIHCERPLEGPRLSCQRTGLTLGNIAPHMLARYIATGNASNTKAERGAGLLIESLVARVGPEKVWEVMDAAPSLFPNAKRGE